MSTCSFTFYAMQKTENVTTTNIMNHTRRAYTKFKKCAVCGECSKQTG